MADVLVEAAIGGAWVDVTTDVYTREDLTIRRGRPDEAGAPDPASCSMTWNNRNGKYSNRNPMSPYFGLLGRNTPVRVSLPGDESYLELDADPANYAATPYTAAMDPVGVVDVRAEVTMDWQDPAASQTLIGRWDPETDQRCWVLRVYQRQLAFSVSSDGTWATQYGWGWTLPLELPPRAAVRGVFDPDASTLAFYWANSLDGPWTEFLAPTAVSGGSMFATATSGLTIAPHDPEATPFRAPFAGRGHRFAVYQGGVLVADPDFRALTPGTGEFTDEAGLPWTVTGDARVADRNYRFVGEVSEWPQRWATSGADAWVPIQAAGVLRRLGQGVTPLHSTLRRRIPSGSPIAYWPMEDGRDADQGYSPTPGVTPLTARNLEWASDSSLPGSDALPTIAKDSWIRAQVPVASRDGWHVEMVYKLDKLPAAEERMLIVDLGGGAPAANAQVKVSTASIKVEVYDSEGDLIAYFPFTNAAAVADFAGVWNRLQVFSAVNGGTLYVSAAWRDVVANTWWYASTSLPGTKAGTVTRVRSFGSEGLSGMALGHLAVFDVGGTWTPSLTYPNVTIYEQADDGFTGETAVDRMLRLASEEALPLYVVDGPGLSEAMGPQQIATLLDNVQEAADADGGLLLERREIAGLQYQQRETLYNQEPALVLDYMARGEVMPPLEPTDDDANLANDVTVARRNGSSARAVLESGPLSVQAPPDGVGVYEDSVTLNLADDDQTDPIAGWRLHLGTVDEARYPTVHIALHAAPHLIEPVLSLDVGDIIRIDNLPEWMPPDPVLLRVEGYEETLNAYRWEIVFNCSPASPWTVGTIGPDDVITAGTAAPSRAATSGSELAAAAASDTTVLLVHTPQDGPVTHAEWITAGHIITPNPTFETDIDSWSPFGGTEAMVPTPQPAPFPGGMSYQLTPDGVTTSPNAFTAQVPVEAGHVYAAGAWLRCTTARTLRLAVNWYSATGYLSTSSLDLPVAAGTWTRFDTTVTAPAGATKANLSPIIIGTATSADVMLVDQAGLRLDLTGGLPAQFPIDLHVGGELVRVASCEPRAWDGFDRTVTGGWGTMTSGKAWNTTGGVASDYSVNGDTGQITLTSPASNLRFGEYFEDLADCELLMLLSVGQVAIGGDLLPGGFARAAGSAFYWCVVAFQADGHLGIEVRSNTAVVGARESTDYIYGPGDRVWLRMRVVGDRVLGRVWPDGDREPGDWQVDRLIDVGTADSGTVGVAAASTATNTDAVISMHDFRLVDPQEMTVTRALNGITKDQPAGADVRLAQPAVTAL